MGKSLSLNSPEYEEAHLNFFRKAFDAELDTYPILNRMEHRITRHSGRLRTVFTDAWDREPTRHEVISIEYGNWVREGDLDDFTLFVRALVEKSAHHRSVEIFKMLANGTKASGQQLPGNPPLSWEAILNAMEKSAPTFSSEGEPKLPELWASVGAWRKLISTPKPQGFEERLNTIINAKREEWNATKRTRRIPRGD